MSVDLNLGDPTGEKRPCSLCNGEGLTYVLSKENIPARQPGRVLETMMTIPCICRLNQRVEDRFACFRDVQDAEEPFIQAALKTWDMNKSYVLNSNPTRFYRLIKALFVHLSRHSRAIYHICNGNEIIKEYYVEQKDDSGRNLFFLTRETHFLVMRFDTRSVNKALQPAVVDIVQARINNGLPTWIWSDGSLDSYQEYSGELQTLLDGGKFVKKSLVVTKAGTNVNDLLKGGNTDA